MTKPTVTVTPRQSYIDEDVTIIISGCDPGEEVSLYSYVTDDENEPFMSKATFITDTKGQVLTSKVAPISGNYNEVDVNGIFWSMSHETKKHGHYFTKTTAQELKITIKLEIDNEVVDEVLIERYFDKGEVTRTDVNEDGTVGTLYQPINEGNYQNIILLAGSDGGRLEHSAALLAAKGFNVLDLSYFNQSGVPKDLENIPLEYFKNSIELLKKITGNREKVTLVGYSRGAELALLLASEYDEFNAVVAGAPSAYITSGLRNSIYAPINSWTINGEAKPYLKFRYRPSTMLYFISKWLTKKPVSFKGIWDSSLKTTINEEVRIKAENIKSPVLLLSGTDDEIWPSSLFSEEIKSRLPQAEHFYYEGAGHFLSFPYALPNMPSTIYEHVGGGMVMKYGGTQSANANAAKESWPIIVSFLQRHAC